MILTSSLVGFRDVDSEFFFQSEFSTLKTFALITAEIGRKSDQVFSLFDTSVSAEQKPPPHFTSWTENKQRPEQQRWS